MADNKNTNFGEGKLIISEDNNPLVKVEPNKRYEVRMVTLHSSEGKVEGKIAARLCGGTTTCLALVEI